MIRLDDPGFVSLNQLGNINRQIYGRSEGLKACSRKYTLILRSDSKVINLNFINEFEKEYEHGKYGTYDFFEHRVICCSTNRHHLFFLCDWFFFGLTEDLKRLYNIELFNGNVEKGSLPEFSTPHEYLGINFCKKYINMDYEYTKVYDNPYMDIWKKIIVENFITLGFYKRFGVMNLKEPYYTNQFLNERLFGKAVYHLTFNFELEDWISLYNKLYKKHLKFHRRPEYILGKYISYSLYKLLRRYKS